MRCLECGQLISDSQLGITRHYAVKHPGRAAPVHEGQEWAIPADEYQRYANERGSQIEAYIAADRRTNIRMRRSKGLANAPQWKPPVIEPKEQKPIRRRRKKKPEEVRHFPEHPSK